jgi:streptogrisin C
MLIDTAMAAGRAVPDDRWNQGDHMTIKSISAKLVIAMFAIGLSIFGLLAAPANAAPSTADRNVISTPADTIPIEMFQALQRDLGVSREQLEQQLAAQNTARRLDTLLKAQLGSGFAGDWFDEHSGKLVVAVTSPQHAAKVRAAGAEPRLVAHSGAKLDAVKTELDALAAADKAAMAGVTAWRVDPQSNAVVVTVLAGQLAAQTLAALARHGNAVRIEQADVAPSLAADYLDGGDPIGGCSVGFNAFGGSTRYVLFAGHCGTVGTQQYGAGGNRVGPIVGASFPGNDYALVRVENTGYWIQGPWVDAYNGGVYNVYNWYTSAPPVGLFVCKSGRTTRFTCGRVTGINESVQARAPDGTLVTVSGLSRHNACVERGDSGGSNISWDASNRAMAEGLTSASLLLADGRCYGKVGQENQSWFQPVGEAISAYGVSLYRA